MGPFKHSRASLLLFTGICSGSCQPDLAPVPADLPVLATIVTTIGGSESLPEQYLFGSVSSVATDALDRIYVADMMSSEIRVFSPQGEFLQTVGRPGQGPGEF